MNKQNGHDTRYGFRKEKPPFTYICWVSSEWGDSFSKHLYLALASDKTNEGVKK